MKNYITLFVFFVFGISQSQASSLPACEGFYWSPCYGSSTHFFGKYTGEFKWGLFHGKGIYTWDNGKRYEGEWNLGDEEGYGTLFEPNGDKYEGEWAYGSKNGQGTSIYGPNSEWSGHIYNGEYKDGKRNGKGTYSWPNGDKYVGEWNDGMQHGHGTVTLATGDKYVGEFKDDIKHGHGSYYWSNGNKYIGYFENNNLSGWGKYVYRNGGKYLGEFENGDYNGQGKFTSWIGIVKEGIWKDGNIIIKKKIEIEPELNPEEFKQAGSGTGFVVSKKGHIISNYHVVEGCSQILIHTKDKTYKSIIIAVDKDNDLSLLQGDFKPKVVFPLSDNQPSLMQDIYVAGFPFGNYYSSSVKVTKGIISSLLGIGDNTNVIQFDAAVQPGNSGGPILDEYGNVVGVTYAALSKLSTIIDFGTLPENANFGVKASQVENLLTFNNVSPKSANKNKISKLDLGNKIKKGTFILSCWVENSGLF